MNIGTADASQRAIQKDEEFGVSLDNTNHDSSKIKQTFLSGVSGAFILSNLLSNDGSLYLFIC